MVDRFTLKTPTLDYAPEEKFLSLVPSVLDRFAIAPPPYIGRFLGK
jgi:hypothetical protein